MLVLITAVQVTVTLEFSACLITAVEVMVTLEFSACFDYSCAGNGYT